MLNFILVIAAPWGIEDLIHMEVKPTPIFLANMKLIKVYVNRVKTKKWEETWDQLKISTQSSQLPHKFPISSTQDTINIKVT
ncbi:nucleotidyltransferase family protein [Neobacillus sp. SAB-20_R2A]|uniref:nucleotidyltransferase family protein n=1 Tax=Neobacillus sp. SAB-20_R2A TaxID=3120519 RepID=UPI003C6E2FDB